MDSAGVDAGTAWSTVVEHARLRVADQKFFRFSEVPSEEPDGGLTVVYDDNLDAVVIGASAARALAEVCEGLATLKPGAVTSDDLTVHVMRHAAEVNRTGGADPSWEELITKFEGWTSGSVVAVPLGGVFSSAPGPIDITDSVVLGHLSRETEDAVADLAVRHGLHGFRFTAEAWWTGDFLAAEADGGIAADLAEQEAEEGTWQPLVLAVALPHVGILASVWGTCVAEAFLGGLVTMHTPEPVWNKPMPWILGQATEAMAPQSPTLNDDGALPVAPIQVDTLPGHAFHGYAPFGFGRPTPDLDLAETLENPESAVVLTRIARAVGQVTDFDGRLITACRTAFAATIHPSDIGLILLRQATRELSSTRSAQEPRELPSLGEAFEESTAHWARFRELLLAACSSD